MAAKTFELDCRDVSFINAALSDQADVGRTEPLECNRKPKRVFQGITPGHEGFVLTDDDRRAIVTKDPASAAVIFPYLIGRELLTGDGTPERWVIDFEQRSLIDCQAFPAAIQRVEQIVLPARRAAAEEGKDEAGNMRPHHRQFLERWWKLAWDRADMVAAIRKLGTRYIVCSRVTKCPIFVFVSASTRPGDALQTFIFDDDYSFGVLQSDAHWRWFVATCSKLKSDYRYTPDTVFDTFPWPQSPTDEQLDAIAAAAREVQRVRADALTKVIGGLRAVYRMLELPGKSPLKDARAALDKVVLDAYGFSPKKDVLQELLALNQKIARRLAAGEPVTPPGVPADCPTREALVSADSVRPRE